MLKIRSKPLMHEQPTQETPVTDTGWAIRMLKNGYKIRRSGWNGKNMYIAYQRGYPDGIPINENTAMATGKPPGTVCKFDPYIMMYTAQGTFIPWLCSQADLLAEDWEIAP